MQIMQYLLLIGSPVRFLLRFGSVRVGITVRTCYGSCRFGSCGSIRFTGTLPVPCRSRGRASIAWRCTRSATPMWGSTRRWGAAMVQEDLEGDGTDKIDRSRLEMAHHSGLVDDGWSWISMDILSHHMSPLYKDQRSHFRSGHVFQPQADIMLDLWQGGLELQREYRRWGAAVVSAKFAFNIE